MEHDYATLKTGATVLHSYTVTKAKNEVVVYEQLKLVDSTIACFETTVGSKNSPHSKTKPVSFMDFTVNQVN